MLKIHSIWDWWFSILIHRFVFFEKTAEDRVLVILLLFWLIFVDMRKGSMLTEFAYMVRYCSLLIILLICFSSYGLYWHSIMLTWPTIGSMSTGFYGSHDAYIHHMTFIRICCGVLQVYVEFFIFVFFETLLISKIEETILVMQCMIWLVMYCMCNSC